MKRKVHFFDLIRRIHFGIVYCLFHNSGFWCNFSADESALSTGITAKRKKNFAWNYYNRTQGNPVTLKPIGVTREVDPTIARVVLVNELKETFKQWFSKGYSVLFGSNSPFLLSQIIWYYCFPFITVLFIIGIDLERRKLLPMRKGKPGKRSGRLRTMYFSSFIHLHDVELIIPM